MTGPGREARFAESGGDERAFGFLLQHEFKAAPTFRIAAIEHRNDDEKKEGNIHLGRNGVGTHARTHRYGCELLCMSSNEADKEK